MSQYTKSTNFATKDNLTPGDPLKVVRGTEIDTEFNNIATAVATKTDNASAAITGGSITGITDLAIADGGTGASTATAALNNLLPSQTGNANKYLQSDGTNATWDAISINTGDITGTLPVANGGTGITSFGSGVATFLGTPSSANLLAAVTDETGTGALVFANTPTLVSPILGTPTSGNFSSGSFTWPTFNQNTTGTAAGLSATLAIASGGTGQTTANAAFNALAPSQTSASGKYLKSDGTNTSWDALDISTADITGTLPVANGGTGVTSSTGTGSVVLSNSPTLVTPILGTPQSGNFSTGTFTWPTFNQNTTGTAAGLSATLATTSGGTGLTSFTSGGVVYASSSSALATGSALTFDGTNLTLANSSGVTSNLTTNQAAGSVGSPLNLDLNFKGYLNTINARIRSWDEASSTGYGYLTFWTSDGTTLAERYRITQNGTAIWNVAGSEQMRLTSTGLGIGTSSPAYKLDVRGTISSGLNYGGLLSIYDTLTSSRVGYVSTDAQAIGNNDTNLAIVADQAGKGIKFFTNNSATLKAFLDSAGNLGLGVTPSAWDTALGSRAIQFTGGSVFNYRDTNLILTQNAYFDGAFKYYASSIAAGYYDIGSGTHKWFTAPSGTAGNTISFTQAMTLSASGGLGVGETSIASDTRLHLKHTTDNCLLKIQSSYSPILRLINGGGSEVSTIDATGNNVLTFQTGSSERARIDSSGNFFIGTTSGTSKLNVTTTTASGAAITFDGNVGNGILMKTTYASATGGTYISFANSDGTATGNISQTGTTTVAYATSSDYRLKENIAPMIGALATVAQLKPCTYTWKSNGSSGQGFIAHELQSVVSDAVVGEKDAVDSDGNPKYQGIDTSFLVATLTAALQEQQAIIESLKARLDAANL